MEEFKAKIAAFRAWIGQLWGHTTTQVLAGLVALQPVTALITPDLMTVQVKWTLLGFAAAVALLRVWAPPPPAAPINKADGIVVDRVNGSYTIAPADGAIPAAVEAAVKAGNAGT